VDREVVLFNNAGVASATGTPPDTIEQTARDAAAFIDALVLDSVDVLGHSMGGLVAQAVGLRPPGVGSSPVLVGTAPRGGVGVGELPPETRGPLLQAIRAPGRDVAADPVLLPSEASQAAGRAYLARMMAPSGDRDAAVSRETVQAQAEPSPRTARRRDETLRPPEGLHQPTLVVNGTTTRSSPTINSYLLQQHAPNAQLIL